MNDKCNPTPFRTSKKGLKAEQKKKTRDEKSLWQDRIYHQKSHIKCNCADFLLEIRFVLSFFKRSFLLYRRVEIFIKCTEIS